MAQPNKRVRDLIMGITDVIERPKPAGRLETVDEFLARGGVIEVLAVPERADESSAPVGRRKEGWK